LNPKFTSSCLLDYYFEETQRLRIVVLDIDEKGSKYEDHDFLGEAYTTIGEVVGARGALSKKLVNPKISHAGSVNIRATEIKDTRSIVHFQFSGVYDGNFPSLPGWCTETILFCCTAAWTRRTRLASLTPTSMYLII
jgi:hypothetical protein